MVHVLDFGLIDPDLRTGLNCALGQNISPLEYMAQTSTLVCNRVQSIKPSANRHLLHVDPCSWCS